MTEGPRGGTAYYTPEEGDVMRRVSALRLIPLREDGLRSLSPVQPVTEVFTENRPPITGMNALLPGILERLGWRGESPGVMVRVDRLEVDQRGREAVEESLSVGNPSRGGSIAESIPRAARALLQEDFSGE